MVAKKKSTSLAVTPRVYGPDAAPIYTTPVGPGLTVGVLRREFSSRINSPAEFVRNKLHPAPCDADARRAQRWAPTCHRHEVLLPATAPDLLTDPEWLMQHYERAVLHDQPALLLAVKVSQLEAGSLHGFWERSREFARSEFVEQRSLPVVLALHVPSLSPSRSPGNTHVHVLVLARTLGEHGFGALQQLDGHKLRTSVADAWLATVA
jgi:hypothetical protein